MSKDKIVNLKDFKVNKDKTNVTNSVAHINDVLFKKDFKPHYTCVYINENEILIPFEIYINNSVPDTLIVMVMYSEFLEDKDKTLLYLTTNFYSDGSSEIFFIDSNTHIVFQNHNNILIYSGLLMVLVSIAKSYFE